MGEEPDTRSQRRPPAVAPTPLAPRKPVAASIVSEYVKRGYWNDRHLRDGIESAAAVRPGALAVVDNRCELSWGHLAARISAGVQRLSVAGVQPGHAVVLISGNTCEGLIAYHSLLRTGALVVLLDRRCGAADVRNAMQSSPASFVVIPSSEIERLEEELTTATVLPLEEFLAGEIVDGPTQGWGEPDRDALAVLLFTSGTTNKPKGVTHSLNTLTRGAQNMATQSSADADTVLFLVSPLTSITGVMQMHMSADQHSMVVLEDAFEPGASLDRINDRGATYLGGAPVIAERLLREADTRTDRRLSLQTLALGGAMLPRPLLERARHGYGIQIVRVYGSSEAPNATGSLPTDSAESRLDNDGALSAGLEVRVGSSVHAQEGMLRGPGLFLGYIAAEDNEAAFEGDWYRTGDLIELANGRVTVVGRLKEVVNRNGFKVSLTEIEAALAGYPGLQELATFGVPDRSTGERLAVAVVPSTGVDVTLDDITGYLRSVGLPTRKMPEQLVIWDEPLPRTTSGKVVRSRLVMDAPSKKTMLADRLH